MQLQTGAGAPYFRHFPCARIAEDEASFSGMFTKHQAGAGALRRFSPRATRFTRKARAATLLRAATPDPGRASTPTGTLRRISRQRSHL